MKAGELAKVLTDMSPDTEVMVEFYDSNYGGTILPIVAGYTDSDGDYLLVSEGQE